MNWNPDGNQFGNTSMDGGGFGSPGGFMGNTTFGSPAASQDKKTQKKESMVPVTVAMLNKLSHNKLDDTCELDGIKIHQVTFVGLITKVNEMATYMSYEIDDFTGGLINVRKWIDKDDNPEEYKSCQFREDTFIRVYGYVKVLDATKAKTVTAFNIHRVTNFNELSYHMLAVVHSWLSLKKMANEGTSMISNQGGSKSFEQDNGLNKIQKQILEVIDVSTSNEGISRNTIRQKLPGIPQNTFDGAIDFLCDEGHIYSTVDDDHFRSTHCS